ncbi:DUF6115 domain-containing protein [Oceanobacillus polygoni]|uniref:Uncharacterized protein n=1 Tax=Oceanobacillus polygoni TaxID=1235259 RepID=A0A9X1CHC2_9BACI|nr:hypothetical protein [Oceanobacillus polygoni]MBP2077682.1 hypothetical protein [Oceanobacillus polygoni]
MVSFLIIISFLLHFITFTAIYMLFQQLKNAKKQDMNEIMELFDTYLQEVKDENNRLQQVLRDHNQRSDNMYQQVKPTKQPEIEMDEYEQLQAIPIPDAVGDTVTASLESRVLQLHNQGLPIDDIAQKLNCGKTEVEIIIKLREKMK